MTQHQLGQIKKDIQPSWCWAKVSEANDLILNPDILSLLVTHYSSLIYSQSLETNTCDTGQNKKNLIK